MAGAAVVAGAEGRAVMLGLRDGGGCCAPTCLNVIANCVHVGGDHRAENGPQNGSGLQCKSIRSPQGWWTLSLVHLTPGEM